MIIVRAPLRITLGGGGTDVPAWYEEHGGLCLAAAIDKYVYITLHETFVDDLIVKYSEMERVADASQVKHPIIREALALMGVDGHGLEIASHADIPAGTGLGSSGAFTVALLGALQVYAGRLMDWRVAEDACTVEIERCREPIGKQDQYMAAYGGLREMTFSNDGIYVESIPISKATRSILQDNLLLFFTGYTRSASFVRTQAEAYPNNMAGVRELADETLNRLVAGDMPAFARMLSRQWEAKRVRPGASNDAIDHWYKFGMENGALGGKLVGAGGGGFLLFYAEDHERLRHAMTRAGLRELPFGFDYEGMSVVCS
jgi:D-glycero-alpha-D-manno-heptose-7-phosphate kinase